jgi:DNA-directed RNA polymerase subunit beta'
MEYLIPRGKHIGVHEGDFVRAGEPLMDGAANPHDILKVLGVKALAKYLVDEIQEVYRLQGVKINDKHIETIVRQMLRKVRISDPGDTAFLADEQTDRYTFDEENDKVRKKGGQPAAGEPLLLGITKASLSTESFISAASFQETTRVLTEPPFRPRRLPPRTQGKRDHGPLNPRGTGLGRYKELKIEVKEEAPVQGMEMPRGQRLDFIDSGRSGLIVKATFLWKGFGSRKTPEISKR